MKCPKCGIDLDENARTCSSCNFSITVDGNPVQLPIIDEPIIPGTFISPKPEVTQRADNTMTMEEQKSEAPQKEESTPVLEEERPAEIAPTVVDTPASSDAPAVELPTVEVSEIPAPVVEETPVAPAPAVETPVAPAPVVDAPVAPAPVAPAPEVEAPVVAAPAVEPTPVAPVVAPPAVEAPTPVVAPTPALEAPAPAPVVTPAVTPVASASPVLTGTPIADNQTAQVVTQMPANAIEVTSAPSQVVVSKPAKKNPILYIVIGVLGVVVVVLAFFLVKSLDNTNKLEPKVKQHEMNQEVINNPETSEDEDNDIEPEALSDEILLYGVKLKLPEGFEYIYENQYYQVFNTELRKLFILDDLYTGNGSELEQGINLMKTEYPSSGCKDVTTTMGSKDGIKYGFVSYVVDNQKLEEIYTLVNDKYILAFYNIQTNIVTTEDFIDYTTSIAKTADDSAANFSTSDSGNKPNWKFNKEILNIDAQDN